MTSGYESTIAQTYNSLFYTHIESLYPILKQLENPKKKDIHVFRIWVKEFKYYLELAEEFTNGKFKRKQIYKFIKPLYRAAGLLRNAQVNQQKFEEIYVKSTSIDPLSKLLKKEKKELESEFKKEVANFHLPSFYKNLHKLLVYLDEDFPDNQLEIFNKYESNSIHNIKDLIHEYYQKDTLHSIRKEIKKIQFVNVTKKCTDIEIKHPIEFTDSLTSLEKHIGKWNNSVSQLDWLNRAANKHNKSYINHLKLSIQSEYLEETSNVLGQLNILIKLI